MKIVSDASLSHLFFKHWHTDDTEVGILIAKARYGRSATGTFQQTTGLPEVHLADTFEGPPETGYLLQEQDIAPGKQGTDLLINAVARSPDGRPRPEWPVEIAVTGQPVYSFLVRGPALWQKGLRNWSLDQPTPVTEVPLTYDLAYGGMAPAEDESTEIYEFNPAGLGFVTPQLLAQKQPFAAPQIGDLAEFMAADVKKPFTVHGTGSIAKSWLPRRSNAGTFDEEWQQYRHPRMPHDYALRFWNAAPTALQFDPYLAGNELISISGVAHSPDPVEARLPRTGLFAKCGDDPDLVRMDLDTVALDVSDVDQSMHVLELTWRCRLAQPDQYDAVRLLTSAI